jgi:ferredoxin-NADP reductase
MSTFDVQLRRREQIADGTMAFHFSKPTGFAFKAGQAVDVILVGEHAAEGDDGRHAFSLVSAPHESELAIATRMRDSAFKRTLRELPIGAPLQIDGPFGTLTLHKDASRPAVLVAGGIGITPFVGMLRHAAREPGQRPITLLYSNKRPEDSAFLAELQQLERDRRIRLLATMTEMSRSALPWSGETRRVDEALLRSLRAEGETPVWYVAGPPAMVRGVQASLAAAGVDEDDVRVEEFHGY